ncbi:TPA: phage tail protein, partial [Enterococcus faecium]
PGKNEIKWTKNIHSFEIMPRWWRKV